jgi:SHS2 domain-containing protein
MSYRYLEDLATADIAFEAIGENLEELFAAAADATVNVMIENLQSIEPRTSKTLHLRNKDLEMLLFELLQELIYYKDAEQLLLRISQLDIAKETDHFTLRALARGEKLDPERHEQRTDVKAVTLHQFSIRQSPNGTWKALVILDV